MIKHVWFDFSETIAFLRKEAHDQLRYAAYAEVVGRSVTPELIREYEELYKKHSHSNAAIFHSLGKPSGYWSEKVNSVNPKELYQLADNDIPEVLKELKALVPISLFSNIELTRVLPTLGIPVEWFTHILNARMVKQPKPALDGFYKMIELSRLSANEILYIGDHVEKDILPAKSVGLLAGLMWTTSKEADYCFGSFQEVLNLLTR